MNPKSLLKPCTKQSEKTEIRDAVNPLRKSVVIFDEKTSLKHFPKTDYLCFDTGTYSQIEAKIVQFDIELANSVSFWTKTDLVTLKELMANLSAGTTGKISADHYSALFKLLTYWPPSHLFPGLDVLRLVLLHQDGAVYFCTTGKNVLSRVVTLSVSSTPFATLLLVFRVIANLFHSSEGRKICEEFSTHLFSAIISLNKEATKDTLQTAIATVLLNYTVYFCNSSKGFDLKSKLITALESLPPQLCEDSLIRVLVALGTLAYKNDSFKKQVLAIKQKLTILQSEKLTPILTELNVVVASNQ